MSQGIRIRHRYHRNILYLVPDLKKPHRPIMCPTCHTVHACKTTHLHLVNGAAIVSEGVLKDLQEAGMPDLDVVEVVAQPPTLEVGRMSRQEQDQRHGRIRRWH